MQRPVHPNTLYVPALGLGVVMIAAAVVIRFLGGEALLSAWYPVAGGRVVADLALGAGLGVGAALGVMWLSDRFRVMGSLRAHLAAMIDLRALRPWHAVYFGLLAGIPEEILFRGAIQPGLGLLLTALLFGLLHAITPLYVVYASLAGLGLGALAAWRGDLWAATAAHAAYDAALFWLLALWTRRQPPM
ncbi:MAG: type II CAAX prenyl endopeptidase Rce1 family protein [Anaerolineales bacterium]